jgi:hypothetical protein
MQIFADGSFAGDLPLVHGYSRESGQWQLGEFDITKGCRNVDFKVAGHSRWTYCFSMGRDKVTGIDCYLKLHVNEGCSMRRRVEGNEPATFDLAPVRVENGRL